MAEPAPRARSPTFATYAAAWLTTHRDRIAPASYAAYEAVLRRHLVPALGALALDAVTRQDVKALLARALHDGASWNTARQLLVVLRVCLAGAVDDGLLVANPASRLGRVALGPRWYRRPPRALTAGELARLLAVRTPCQGLFLVLARTGLRIGEALGLQWADWRAETRTLHVARQWRRGGVVPATKTRRVRVVDVSAQAAVALSARRHRGVWIFAGPAGVPVSETTVRYWLDRALARAGVPRITVHGFRHSFASQVVANGAPLAWVQRQLGHASIRTTVDVYGRHLPMRGLEYVDALDG